MKIEDQVCCLGLSKKLKELGVKQESLFVWETGYEPFVRRYDEIINNLHFYKDYYYLAYSASELLEMLPIWSDISKMDDKDYMCRVFQKNSDINHHSFDKNPCNALARMLIHLIENKIIEI